MRARLQSHCFQMEIKFFCSVWKKKQNMIYRKPWAAIVNVACFLFLRPICKSVVDAQRQTGGEEEDGGNETLPEPCF